MTKRNGDAAVNETRASSAGLAATDVLYGLLAGVIALALAFMTFVA